MRLARLRSYDFAKRVLDVMAAGAGLVVMFPLLLAVSCAVVIALGRPVIFAQKRPGLFGRPFMMVKFRSMRAVDERQDFITDEQRLTPFGKWLRSTSLDELPTLWNVLRGDMSLVGPRPLLMEYLAQYTPEQARRHAVRPGITGLAQVSGRNALDWQEKFRLDVEYVERRCMTLDFLILARTAQSLVVREGISAPGHATAHRFGSADG